MWRALFAFCLTLWATIGQAEERAEAIIAAYGAWLDSVDAEGVIALRYAGEPVADVSFGWPVDRPIELASVGKSITAACIHRLVEDGAVSYDASFADVVGRGPNVTIAQLVTHASGLRKDSTQKDMPGWAGDAPHRAADVLDRVIARDAPDRGPGRYGYNNENYALLGLVVEAVTGDSYERACRARVLTPLGLQAEASPIAGAYLPWGGWVMRADDYAAWHAQWYGPEGPLGQTPLDHPHVELAQGIYHGVGSFVRPTAEGGNHWYFGALCLPGRINIGSYAVTWGGGWTLVAGYDACVTWDDMARLDQTLVRAAFGTE